jgi:hypothetical protein
MIKTETKTLQLQFADTQGTKISYAVKNPKDGLDKAAIDAAAKTIIDSKLFATKNGDLAELKAGNIVTHTVETMD